MKKLISTALRFENNQLKVLNQRLLPQLEEWVVCQNPTHMCEIIRTLQVRGAPLIGVAAALSLAHFAESSATESEIVKAANDLKNARPTAVNLSYCIDQLLQNKQKIVETAEKLFEEDAELCENIAKHGSRLFENQDSVLTHCNTGGLVTTGIGTALGVLFRAQEEGKNIHVFVDETRPLLQAGRLTTWELQRASIPHTLICDNMAASLMRAGKIQKVIVGADRIARNGDFANKIGTYSVARLSPSPRHPLLCGCPLYHTRCTLQDRARYCNRRKGK